MPREDRLIIFSYSEFYNALYALSTQRSLQKPPTGAVTGVVENPDGFTDKIRVEIHNPIAKVDKDITVDYARDFAVAALMLYCRSQSIPLPKTAQKSVMVRKGEVMLRVQI